MYTIDDYRKMINHYYYIDEIPVGKIINITKDVRDYYVIELDTNDLPIPHYPKYEKFSLAREHMDYTYEQFLLREQRSIILRHKNITSLVHFTKIENLPTILQRGILSDNILDRLGIPYSKSDEYRWDNKLDFVCNSISFPNYKMFYAKRMEDNEQKWAVLTINSDILVHKLSTEFYKTNRANSIYNCSCKVYNTNECLNDMFYQENRDDNLPSNYTTDPQAEVLIKNSIKVPYIQSVETNEYNEDIKKLTKNFNVGYNPNSSYFAPRCDYRRW